SGGLNMSNAGLLTRRAFVGNMTVPAGLNVSTITAESVTFARMQNLNAAILMGRGEGAGAGDPEEIQLHPTLQIIGTELSVNENEVPGPGDGGFVLVDDPGEHTGTDVVWARHQSRNLGQPGHNQASRPNSVCLMTDITSGLQSVAGANSVILGGRQNDIDLDSDYSVICGGSINKMEDEIQYSFIGTQGRIYSRGHTLPDDHVPSHITMFSGGRMTSLTTGLGRYHFFGAGGEMVGDAHHDVCF
ncbi:unnamed protein product, partial [marine sediment metagenome]